MAQQSSGEFASTNPTTRTQDARFQERRISAKISLLSCGSLQHLQRLTPSHLSKKLRFSRVGGERMTRGRRDAAPVRTSADRGSRPAGGGTSCFSRRTGSVSVNAV